MRACGREGWGKEGNGPKEWGVNPTKSEKTNGPSSAGESPVGAVQGKHQKERGGKARIGGLKNSKEGKKVNVSALGGANFRVQSPDFTGMEG